MSAILEGTPDKRLALVTGRAYPEQAEETAKYLGTTVLETTAYDFAAIRQTRLEWGLFRDRRPGCYGAICGR